MTPRPGKPHIQRINDVWRVTWPDGTEQWHAGWGGRPPLLQWKGHA